MSLGNIIFGGIVIVLVVVAIYRIYKNKTSGKGTCGCNGGSGCDHSCH